ncbi:O-antigen polymerase [Mesorhizobium sp. M0203]|uniref:O-antigen polymerase n=1 Tax=Mesorhizobium sp. M0203 TaxID=2956912 RepID=UPI00333C0F78
MYIGVQLLLFVLMLPLALSWIAGDTLVLYPAEAGYGEFSALLLIIHVFTSVRIVVLSTNLIDNIGQICFYTFIYIWIVLIPSMQMYQETWPLEVFVGVETNVFVLEIVAISILAFEAGNWTKNSRRYFAFESKAVVPKNAVIYLFFGGYSLSFTYFVLSIGDVSLLLGARVNSYAAVFENNTAKLVADALFRTPIVVLCQVFFSLFLAGMHRRVVMFWPMAFASTLMLLVSNFPTAQARGRIGSVLVAFIVIWIVHQRPRLARWFPTIMCAGVLIIFPLLSQTRRQVDWESLSLGGVRQAYFQGSFDAYQMLGVIIDYTNTHGSQWGRQFLGALLFWVPRSVWPDKPIGTGAQVATDLGLSFTNLSAPLWSEAYINFGLIGVLVTFFALGRVSGAIGGAFLDKSGAHMIFGSFFVGFQILLLRGDLMSSFTLLLPFMICVAAMFWKSERVSVFRMLANTGMKHAERDY